MTIGDAALSSWLDPLWRRVLYDWNDEAAHRAILAQCQSPECLAKVAGMYRSQLEDPEKAAIARRQLDHITALAMAQLGPRPRPESSGQPWKIAWLLLLLLGVVALARQL